MKTAILQCLQQFSSKNSKNVYHDQIIILKLQCHCKIVQNVEEKNGRCISGAPRARGAP